MSEEELLKSIKIGNGIPTHNESIDSNEIRVEKGTDEKGVRIDTFTLQNKDDEH